MWRHGKKWRKSLNACDTTWRPSRRVLYRLGKVLIRTRPRVFGVFRRAPLGKLLLQQQMLVPPRIVVHGGEHLKAVFSVKLGRLKAVRGEDDVPAAATARF